MAKKKRFSKKQLKERYNKFLAQRERLYKRLTKLYGPAGAMALMP
jgi:hypothetical protein